MEGKARTKRGGQGFLLSMMPVLLLAVALLLAWPLFSGGADAYAETDYVTRVDLETTFEIPERIPVGGEVPLVYADPGCIQVTAVESTYEMATPGDFSFEWGDAGWYVYDPEWAEFMPYQEDTTLGDHFLAGENRFVIPLLINEDADVKFSSSCQYYLNGQRMEVDKYYNSLMQDVDLHLSVYDKDVIREVYLRGQTEDPWTGLTVVQPGMTVKKVIAKSGRIANDTVSVNTAKSGWQYGNSSDKYFYHNGDTFTEGSAWLQVDLWTADSSGDYIFTDDTKVYLNASEYDYDYLYVELWGDDPVVSDGSNCVAYQHYSVHDPEISASVCLVDGSGWDSCGKVSTDGSDWHGNVADNYALGSSATIYAQAQEGYQFLEWRRRETNGEVVGTTNPLTVAVSGPERYYAIFEPVVPAIGHLNSTVDYSFDEATGTLTLIPTEDDGEGGKTGTADGIGYGLSPFKGNQKIKHVVVREGIRVIGEFVFQDNNAIQ
ncbi:MAG: hypothetical protein K5707_07155, partial [Clostridia bacterium]|nr:hypothetical protein [Clostridia bacterium]